VEAIDTRARTRYNTAMIDAKNRAPDSVRITVRDGNSCLIHTFEDVEIQFGKHWLRVINTSGHLVYAVPTFEVISIHAIDAD